MAGRDKKQILISGYYGFHNAGDEAILAGIIAGFRELASETEFTVLSEDPAATRRDHQVEALPRLRPLVIWRAIRHADLVISGGGGLLQDTTSWRSPLYYLGIVLLAKLARKPVMFFAQGIGPLRRSWIRRLVAMVANRVDLITVRDEASARQLARLGVKRPVRVTLDPCFLIPPAARARLKEIWEIEEWTPGRQPTIGVCLRRWRDRRWLGEVAAALDALDKRLNAQILFIPMQRPSDARVSLAAFSVMDQSAHILSGHYLPHELSAIISSVDLVISVRLHALMFAAHTGVPVVGLSYDPKVDTFMESLGQPVLPLADLKAGQLVQTAEQVWQERKERQGQILSAIASHQEDASENIRLALELLERSRRA